MKSLKGAWAAMVAAAVIAAITLSAGPSLARDHWGGGGRHSGGWSSGGTVRYKYDGGRSWGGGRSYGGRSYGGGFGYYRPYYHSRPRTSVRFGIGFSYGSPYYYPPSYGYYYAPRPIYVAPRPVYVDPGPEYVQPRDRDDDEDDDSDRGSVHDHDSDRDSDRDSDHDRTYDRDRTDRVRGEDDVDVTNEPPAGCYYYDRFCGKRFSNLDDYTDHLHDKHHTETIEIIDRSSGGTIRTLEYVDGLWQVQRQ